MDGKKCHRKTHENYGKPVRFLTVPFDKIIIVKEEIESWFLAGIDSKIDQFKNFIVPNNTDSITKEIFDDMLKKIPLRIKIVF